MNPFTKTDTDNSSFVKSRRIDDAIRTKNIWLLRSLALSHGGLCHGKQRFVLLSIYLSFIDVFSLSRLALCISHVSNRFVSSTSLAFVVAACM
jgi:hypothetical protein